MANQAGYCPVCSESVGDPDPKGRHLCSRCGVPHHKDCWDFNEGKCGIFGCGGLIIDNVVVRSRFWTKTIFIFCVALFSLVSFALFTEIVFRSLRVEPGQIVFYWDHYYEREEVRFGGQKYPAGVRIDAKFKQFMIFKFYRIDITSNDGKKAVVSGSLLYGLPKEPRALIDLYESYETQKSIEDRIVQPDLADATIFAGRSIDSRHFFYPGSYKRLFEDLIQEKLTKIVSPKPSLFHAYGFEVKRIIIDTIKER